MAQKEYIRLYDYTNRLIAVLENAYNIEIEETLGEAETLSFSLPFQDPKADLLMNDEEIIYYGKRYIITQITDGRDEEGKESIEVFSELCYIELLNYVKPRDFEVLNCTPEQGLVKILEGTHWQIGTVEGNISNKYSLKETNQTVLYLIRQWAKITGLEILWDSINRKVSLVNQIGSDNGAVFRYKKNIKSIKRTMQPPAATVLYPYGANNITIAGFNNGKEYLEDYSWYISQGFSENEARAKFRKEYIWQDDSFLSAGALVDAAVKKLAELSQPVISYECVLLDLSAITGLSEDDFGIGDYVRVIDEDLGIDINGRVLRLKKYPNEPWNNEVEISYIVPGLHDAQTTGGGYSESTKPGLLLGINNDPVTVTQTVVNPIPINMSTFADTNALIGLMIVGQASAQLTLTVKFTLSTREVGPIIRHTCTTGWNTIGVPFVLAQIPSGDAVLSVSLQADTGTFTIPKDHLQVYVYASSLLSSLSSETPRALVQQTVDISGILLTPGESIIINVHNGVLSTPEDTISTSDVLLIPNESITITFGT